MTAAVLLAGLHQHGAVAKRRVERHPGHLPAYDTMRNIARALGRDVDYLFFEVDNETVGAA